MSPERARIALEALWACMVEIAEETNDIVVDAQRDAGADTADAIARGASDLAALARAAEALASLSIRP